MRSRDIIILFVCIVVAVALLFLAGNWLDYINSQRQQMKLIVNEPLENAPPSLAFATVAMGAFRGLVVDILWVRADNLKEQGQYFDAKQLAEWITILQPRFAAVWQFHAWNMAYNISVAIPAGRPDQRWQWVRNGYELLRDKGIPRNPKSIALYRELARIFQHKIGGVSDDAHRYYKLQLAQAMEPLLGPADNEYFEALAKAPLEFRQISEDPNIGPLISALKAADNVFADDKRFVANYLSLRQNPGRFNPAVLEVIGDNAGKKALKDLDIFARAWELRNTWKLDPALMQDLNSIYGPIDWADPNRHLPLDWRHPDSHAIYWGVKGLREVGKDEDREISITETNTDRIVIHSLTNLFRYGRIYIYEVPAAASGHSPSQEARTPRREIFMRPDPRMIEPYHQAAMAVLEKYERPSGGSYRSLRDGHRNMLKNATLLFYQSGHEPQARRYYNLLRKMYPEREEFKDSLVVFARKRFVEELQSVGIYDAQEQITALLRESYFRYAMRDDDEAYTREKLARDIWDYYRKQFPDEQRVDLAPFSVLQYTAFSDFLDDGQYPASLKRGLVTRVKIEKPELFEQMLEQQKKELRQLQQAGTPE